MLFLSTLHLHARQRDCVKLQFLETVWLYVPTLMQIYAKFLILPISVDSLDLSTITDLFI